ncbi:MAG: hypothetical protein HFH59_06660 [Lachnospiraceae bacterium]|nr:hypothetical protein [Lachnospiraceae bacterium]
MEELREIKGLLQEVKEAEATRYLFPAYESDTKEAAAPSIEERISLGAPGGTIELQAPHSEPDILYRWIEAQTALAQQIVREKKESIHKDISEKPESITLVEFERLMHDWIRGNRNRINFKKKPDADARKGMGKKIYYRTKAAMKILMELTRKEAFEFLEVLDDVQKKICYGSEVFPFDKMAREEAVRELKVLLEDGELEIPRHLKGHLERFLELMINERAPMDELLFECNSALNVLLHYDLLKPDDPNGAAPEAENTVYYFSDEDAKEIEKELWLEGIGAEVFPKPAGYTYTFPGCQGAFFMSKEYADKAPLDELKKAYEQNKQYALSVIQAEYGCVDSVQVLGEQGEINLEEFNRLMESWLKNSPRIEF